MVDVPFDVIIAGGWVGHQPPHKIRKTNDHASGHGPACLPQTHPTAVAEFAKRPDVEEHGRRELDEVSPVLAGLFNAKSAIRKTDLKLNTQLYIFWRQAKNCPKFSDAIT